MNEPKGFVDAEQVPALAKVFALNDEINSQYEELQRLKAERDGVKDAIQFIKEAVVDRRDAIRKMRFEASDQYIILSQPETFKNLEQRLSTLNSRINVSREKIKAKVGELYNLKPSFAYLNGHAENFIMKYHKKDLDSLL
eukprot:TRINITY_DN13926_c0_g1_i2.p1 TRINITY_DN13926_c0_g1~~TRINITY_DN13926_c0_g1_i2.p1  ORF type:complete len:140 (-),score=21.22 TRINITY_DN13926_c0_g1_i2:80-499(-)